MPNVLQKIALQLLIGATGLCACGSANAQTIPNGSFENWNTTGSKKLADGWNTSEDMGMGCSPATVVKSTDKAAGNSSLLLQTSTCTGAGGVHEGFAFITFPISNKPDSLKFMYKLTDVGFDTAYIELRLQRRLPTGKVELAKMRYGLKGNQNTFKQMSIPISYKVNNTPDTAFIEISSDGIMSPALGNKLWIDELQFVKKSTTFLNSVTNSSINDVQLYPVPAENMVHISYSVPEHTVTTLRVHAVNGQLLYEARQNAASGLVISDIDVSGFASGMYFYTIQPEQGTGIAGRFIKQ